MSWTENKYCLRENKFRYREGRVQDYNSPRPRMKEISNKYSVHEHFDLIIYSTIRIKLSPFHSSNSDRLMV